MNANQRSCQIPPSTSPISFSLAVSKTSDWPLACQSSSASFACCSSATAPVYHWQPGKSPSSQRPGPNETAGRANVLLALPAACKIAPELVQEGIGLLHNGEKLGLVLSEAGLLGREEQRCNMALVAHSLHHH